MDTGLKVMPVSETVTGPGLKHSGPLCERFVDVYPYGAS